MSGSMTVAMVVLLAAVTGCAGGGDAIGTTSTSAIPPTATTVDATSTTTSTTQPTTTSTATTTTLPEPPHLEILDPVHSATVASASYTFTGVTDPGCSVTVGGKYEATVAEDGSWVLDLMLAPGRNSTTFTATHPETELETSEAIRVYYTGTLELRGDGLGVVSFGDPVEDVMVILTDLLGPPMSHELHTGVWGEESSYGSFHEVKWKGLRLEFIDWDIDWMPLDSPVFSYWTTGRSLRTPEGVGPGSLWADMVAAYGDGAKVWSEDCGEYSGGITHFFSVEIDGEGYEHIAGYAYFGWLTDDPSDPASAVTHMEAGREAFPQGC